MVRFPILCPENCSTCYYLNDCFGKIEEIGWIMMKIKDSLIYLNKIIEF